MRSFKAAPEVLSAWMDARKLTAAELSRQTGIDAGILRKIMTGRETAVSTRNLMTLARYFGLSMQELLNWYALDCSNHRLDALRSTPHNLAI